jgi:hypothetical protein
LKIVHSNRGTSLPQMGFNFTGRHSCGTSSMATPERITENKKDDEFHTDEARVIGSTPNPRNKDFHNENENRDGSR